jgi:hypothetical protein
VRDALQQRGDLFVRSGGGSGEMPGAPRVVSAVLVRQFAVDGAPFVSGGQINDRRPDQRMPERDATAAEVDADEPGPCRRSERVCCRRAADCVESGQVTGAVEGGGEQQMTGRR